MTLFSRGRAMSFAYVTLVLAVLCGSAQAVQFYLEFGQQLCFQEPLPSDTKVVGEYMVAAGKGDMPVEIEVKDGSETVVFSKMNASHGKFSFKTPVSAGMVDDDYYDYYSNYGVDISATIKYEICFTHKPPAGTVDHDESLNRRVSFKILQGSTAKDYEKIAKSGHLSSLEVHLESMNDELNQLLTELEDVRLREDALRVINEHTNKHVVTYSAIACVIMLCVGGYQMIHMKSYFRKKKLI